MIERHVKNGQLAEDTRDNKIGQEDSPKKRRSP